MSSPVPLRFALIGTGSIGRWQTRELLTLPGLQLVGAADESPAARARFAADYPQVPLFADPAPLLAQVPSDFVTVCTPNSSHAAHTLAALAAGRHVFCEKPMALTVADAERMEAARAAAGLHGGIHFANRAKPGFRFMRYLVQAGEIGPVQRVHAVFHQSFLSADTTPWAWRFDATLAGFGTIGDLGVHLIDTVRYLTALEFTRVIGATRRLVTEKSDPSGQRHPVTTDTHAAFLAELNNGALATFETTQAAPGYGNHFRVELSGPRGTVVHSIETPDHIELYSGDTLSRLQSGRGNLPHVSIPSFPGRDDPKPVAAFAEALRGGPGAYPTFTDGIRAQRILHAILDSEKSRLWVELPS